MKRIIDTHDAPRPQGAYSQAVVVEGTVYVAGQGPYHPQTGVPVGETIAEQTRQTLRNLEAILRAAGMGLTDVVRVGAHIDSFDLFDDYDAVYSEFFADVCPARTTVASELGGILVEIDAVAIKGAGQAAA
ncbi:MAG TPA: Rid family detoxifying hydrolase [Conexibacter sp.]|nr:Rid family detoxifying hydrolase [Conexibacter sp.]